MTPFPSAVNLWLCVCDSVGLRGPPPPSHLPTRPESRGRRVCIDAPSAEGKLRPRVSCGPAKVAWASQPGLAPPPLPQASLIKGHV